MSVVAFMTLANLRGAKESGTLFAIPTYLYILALTLLIGVGLWRLSTGDLAPLPVDDADLRELGGGSGGLVGVAGALLLARAFSSGAVALTGTEAITNGIQAFRPPESRNAATTLVLLAAFGGRTTALIPCTPSGVHRGHDLAGRHGPPPRP